MKKRNSLDVSNIENEKIIELNQMAEINTTQKLPGFNAHIVETLLVALTIFYATMCALELLYAGSTSANHKYYTNPTIIIVATYRTIFALTFLLCFLYNSFYTNTKRIVSFIYFISALVIGFLEWFELYYRSTFYNAEKDKQGFRFPILASLLTTLIIWKIQFSTVSRRDRAIKICLSIVLNASLYALWVNVQGPWYL